MKRKELKVAQFSTRPGPKAAGSSDVEFQKEVERFRNLMLLAVLRRQGHVFAYRDLKNIGSQYELSVAFQLLALKSEERRLPAGWSKLARRIHIHIRVALLGGSKLGVVLMHTKRIGRQFWQLLMLKKTK